MRLPLSCSLALAAILITGACTSVTPPQASPPPTAATPSPLNKSSPPPNLDEDPAYTLLTQGRYAESIALSSHALAVNPNSAYAYLMRGQAKEAAHDHRGAVADLQQARALDATDTRIYYWLGVAELYLDPAATIANETKAIAADQHTPDA